MSSTLYVKIRSLDSGRRTQEERSCGVGENLTWCNERNIRVRTHNGGKDNGNDDDNNNNDNNNNNIIP